MALGLLAAALIAGGCSSLGKDGARRRVTVMMDAWRAGGTSSDGNMQEAVSMWYQGARAIADDVELSRAASKFDAWRRQKQLYGSFQRWEITAIDPDPATPAMIVALNIDGKPYRMRVESGEPIEWVP
jgi:hypothetical protein